MKILIVSDTHDNLENLKKIFDYTHKKNIRTLIHCGDVCNGDTLSLIEKNFDNIYLALGNADLKFSLFEKPKKTKIFESKGEVEIEGLKIGFCHIFNLKEQKENLKRFDFFFFGHTHWPFLKKEKNCFLANPGNLAGLFYKPTFAVLDSKTKKLELKFLEKLG